MPSYLKRIISFCTAILFLSGALIAIDCIFNGFTADMYNLENYLLIGVVFGLMAAAKYWAAAGVFGGVVFVGSIAERMVWKSRQTPGAQEGGMFLAILVITAFVAAVAVQYIVYISKGRKNR